MRRHFNTPRSSRAFTLGEVLVATLFFGMVILAVSTVMRTAIRSWRSGHEMMEVVQTGAVSKDMILRDLDNMTYLRQQLYNRTFQSQLGSAASMYQADFVANRGNIGLDDRFDFEAMTPPVDLSFRIQDGGQTDQLTFVRSHSPRFAGDPETWGMRRVTYYVESSTLWRKEDDPFGYRPGSFDESFYNATPTAMDMLAERFMKPDGYDNVDAGRAALDRTDLFLPEPYSEPEPLCEGVTSFEIAAGYFKAGEWVEANTWDSSARNFRKPPRMTILEDQETIDRVKRTLPQLFMMIDGRPTVVQDRGQPDDIPGYIRITMGATGPRAQGKPHRFTFFHALPLGEERDVVELTAEEIEQGFFPDVELNPSRRRKR